MTNELIASTFVEDRVTRRNFEKFAPKIAPTYFCQNLHISFFCGKRVNQKLGVILQDSKAALGKQFPT
jgi:hypothetical protein